MARQITQTLRNLPIISSYSRTFCLFSNKPQIIEIDLTQSSPNPNPDLSAGIQHLEDAIHTIIVRRLQPDWLPFRPGSSFWAPPRKSVATNLVNLAAVGNNNNNPINYPLSNEESLSLVSGHGWPSSNYFLTHLDSPPGVEVNIFSQNMEDDASQSEDDDNDV